MYSVARLIKELPESYEEEYTKQGAVKMTRHKNTCGFNDADFNTPAKWYFASGNKYNSACRKAWEYK